MSLETPLAACQASAKYPESRVDGFVQTSPVRRGNQLPSVQGSAGEHKSPGFVPLLPSGGLSAVTTDGTLTVPSDTGCCRKPSPPSLGSRLCFIFQSIGGAGNKRPIVCCAALTDCPTSVIGCLTLLRPAGTV